MIAFVFPGQGSQAVGMGQSLHEAFPEVREIYRRADSVLGYSLSGVSFNGPVEELNRTEVTQPALLTASLAAYTVLAQAGIRPAIAAGHSLGEYSALAAAGVFSIEDAVALTRERGRLMQSAVAEGRGLMAAVLGLDRQTVEESLSHVGSGYVAAANFNCPGQIVISGEKVAVEEGMELLTKRGARRVVPLAVSVPSHCRLMDPASEGLARVLDGLALGEPQFPIVANADARPIRKASEVRDSLIRQLSCPLFWEDSIRLMIDQGVRTIVEVGLGKVLAGLIRKISGDLRVLNVSDRESLDLAVKSLTEA